MPNLSIKDVPEAWAQALRERAARNHRSLQGELMALIQRVVEPDSLPPDTHTKALTSQRRGWKTVEQIAAELRANPHDAKLCSELPRGVDIIREDRDSR
jgi:plasmid stability protein